jgi:mitotic spindle assembly checkpoint protein MAD2
MMELSDNNSFTLRGSSEVVTEFFEYCVNNILYQRGIYPPESFKRVPKYGLSMVITTDESVSAYITNIINQLNGKLVINSC